MIHSKVSAIKIGLGSCGIAAGGQKVHDALKDALEEKGIQLPIGKTGCNGMCFNEVLVEVEDPVNGRVIYGDVTPEKLDRLVEEHICNGRLIPEWLAYSEGLQAAHNDFIASQKRIVLGRCGAIDPESIQDAIDQDAYKALKKALTQMTPQEVIEEIKASGLRGRGGGGFPTGLKWEFTARSTGRSKYMICNADEGDPGAFMDRSVLESDPHAVLEGITIAGYSIGAQTGYIYCRAEYPLAIKHLKKAIHQSMKKGFLGDRILDTDFSFHIKIKEGAGAFVCGEETALIASIEGKRGMPRYRPPFPAQSGLWGKPTCINNVETLATIPWVIRNGSHAYAGFGTEKSKGTKVFALAGRIKRGGLIEVPMGMAIRDVINKVGGGSSSGKRIKAVQLGGPSGGCIPERLFDTSIDYESVTQTGAIMGSGGMVVMDEDSCMVDVARFFLSFTQLESCGKCTFCRVGTLRMLEILERITKGDGREEDLQTLESLAYKIKESSLCGLGQTAPNPVLTTIKYFRDEYEAHIREKRCPAGVCKSLITYIIQEEKCVGCGRCLKLCPVGAITGSKKTPHKIDQEKCTKCGACFSGCKFEAIVKE
ncbi:MAG: NADH-quinone oxidoreductase subunit NuoF [bacterium]